MCETKRMGMNRNCENQLEPNMSMWNQKLESH